VLVETVVLVAEVVFELLHTDPVRGGLQSTLQLQLLGLHLPVAHLHAVHPRYLLLQLRVLLGFVRDVCHLLATPLYAHVRVELVHQRFELYHLTQIVPFLQD